jgi:hypothetical protein
VDARHEIDLDQIVLNAKQRNEEARTMCVARQRMIIELHDPVPNKSWTGSFPIRARTMMQ